MEFIKTIVCFLIVEILIYNLFGMSEMAFVIGALLSSAISAIPDFIKESKEKKCKKTESWGFY